MTRRTGDPGPSAPAPHRTGRGRGGGTDRRDRTPGIRAFAVVVLVAVLLVPAVQAAPWTQPRGDAAATGSQPEEGPAWPDVALRLRLEGSWKAEADAPPLILEDRVLFLARPYGVPDDTDYRVVSVDVDTGEVSVVADGLPVAGRLSMATDGTTLYVSSRRTVHAVPLEPGGHEWTWDGTGDLDGTDREDWRMEFCHRMALDASHVTVLCWAHRVDQAWCESFGGGCGSFRGNALVARIDAETGRADGEHGWMWTVPRDPRVREPDRPGGGASFPIGLAVAGSHVVVLTSEGGCSCQSYNVEGNEAGYVTGEANSYVWSLDTETGERDWHKTLQSANVTYARVGGRSADVEDEPFRNVGNPAVADGAVYVKAGKIHKLNLGSGDVLWRKAIGQEDVDPNGGRSGAVSVADGRLYTTTAQTLYRVEGDNPESGWSASLNFSAEEGFGENTIVTPSTVYNTVWTQEGIEALWAFDTGDGAIRWKHPATDIFIFSYAVGHGRVAYTDVAFHDDDNATTTLVVLGRTGASPTPRAEPTTAYPTPGEPVEVDLSGSTAGLQGPTTRYKAIWGDGTETGWQDDPVLAHTYDEAGDVEARFLVANDADQTASTTRTFHVGEVEPNLISTAFAPEHQDLTFGVLGIALALGGGAVGIARRRKSRARLQDELDALEDGFEQTRDNPGECEAFLDNRKARARSLLMDGELSEEQFGVVERRVEELQKRLRTHVLDARFQYLPHGMVESIKKMLADGRLTAWERDALEDLLQREETLTEAQKDKVRAQLDRWFSEDARGPVG